MTYRCSICQAEYPNHPASVVCCMKPDLSKLETVIPPLTGGSSDYYRKDIAKPLKGHPYSAECLDIIMALEMTFAEGEAFKAIWRKAAARQGNGKPGNSALYNAEKVAFMGQAMVRFEGGE